MRFIWSLWLAPIRQVAKKTGRREKMDPELLHQKAAFKKRAMAVPVVERKKESAPRPSGAPKKKKKSKLKRPKPQAVEGVEKIGQSVLVGPRSNMPYRVLKAVVDMMGRRYAGRDYEPLTLEGILEQLGLADLRMDTRDWLSLALKDNPKILYYPAGEKYLFKPTLGLEVRNRRQLLERLRDNDRQGLGGIPMSEIREAVHNSDKAMARLVEEGLVMKLTRYDKEEIVFYNDHSLQLPMAEEFRGLWHRVSVDGLTESDIDKHLQVIGLGAMQGEARKRRAPSTGQKTKKKARVTKVLNTHLDSSLLKDYSEKTS